MIDGHHNGFENIFKLAEEDKNHVEGQISINPRARALATVHHFGLRRDLFCLSGVGVRSGRNEDALTHKMGIQAFGTKARHCQWVAIRHNSGNEFGPDLHMQHTDV
jgi:hypothetical protein